MPSILRIHTFGGVRILLDDEPLQALASRKAEALLIYLACTGHPQPREHLGELLWDDRPQAQALGNLSVLLTSLRKQLKPFLDVSRRAIGLRLTRQIQLDTLELERALSRASEADGGNGLSQAAVAALVRASQVYAGDFIAGFHIREARNFEEWALLARERYHHLALEVGDRLVEYHLGRREYTQAESFARDSLALDPLRELSHRQYMLSLARQGDFAGAISQYRRCQEVLATELAVEPSTETRLLNERIQAAARAPERMLPRRATVLIGREKPLADVVQRLADPKVRLVTILGPGGVGKTQLAVHAIRELTLEFLNGVHFVPLASVQEAGQVPSAIAASLQVSFEGEREIENQLVDSLRAKETLLVLDTYEHLLDSVSFLVKLLERAPAVKLLVTSRARLTLLAEWIYELEGLSAPGEALITGDQAIPAAEFLDFSAVRLFQHIASRQRPDFDLTVDNARAVGRITHLVEGMPLAIELAASWVRTLSCEQIAEEISHNLDFLSSQVRDLPPRHRQLRAVFDQSWRLLSPREQHIYPQLAIFPAGFDRAAAEAVAGATLADLASLVDKSLLRVAYRGSTSGEARYELHDLLQQYALEILVRRPSGEDEARQQHSQYFARRLDIHSSAGQGAGEQDVLADIGLEIENLRQAWLWAVSHHLLEALPPLLAALDNYYWIRGWIQEAYLAWGEAVRALGEGASTTAGTPEVLERVLASLRRRQGLYAAQLSHFDEAETLLQQALDKLREMNAPAELVACMNNLAIVDRMRGKYHQAEEVLQESLAVARSSGDRPGLAKAHNSMGAVSYRLANYKEAHKHYSTGLKIYQELGDKLGMARARLNVGSVDYRLGHYETAMDWLKQGLELSRKIGDRWGEAACLNNLANVYIKLEEFPKAQHLYEESLSIKIDMGHRKGITQTQANLGKVAFNMGEYRKATEIYTEALAGSREIEDRWALSNGLSGLGRAQLALSQLQPAWEAFKEALAIAWELDSLILIEQALVDFAELQLAREGEVEATELAAYIAGRPARTYEVQERAERLLTRLKIEVPEPEGERLKPQEDPRLKAVVENFLLGSQKNSPAEAS